MESPAAKALQEADTQNMGKPATNRFVSGISIAAPLISAVIQGETEDISNATNEILDAAKTLIDHVSKSTEAKYHHIDAIIELCVHSIAAAWTKDGCCEPTELIVPIISILSYTNTTVTSASNHPNFGFATVFCALSEVGLLGEDCIHFHGVCDEIHSGVTKSTNKWKALNAATATQLDQFSRSLHKASCDLFVSTLHFEYKQFQNESYRAAVDPSYKQGPFDMGVFMRRYRVYSNHLFEAIYVNATRR